MDRVSGSGSKPRRSSVPPIPELIESGRRELGVVGERRKFLLACHPSGGPPAHFDSGSLAIQAGRLRSFLSNDAPTTRTMIHLSRRTEAMPPSTFWLSSGRSNWPEPGHH